MMIMTHELSHGSYTQWPELELLFCFLSVTHTFIAHRLWDVSRTLSPLIDTIAHHREFTYGLSFNPLVQGRVSYYNNGNWIHLILEEGRGRGYGNWIHLLERRGGEG